MFVARLRQKTAIKTQPDAAHDAPLHYPLRYRHGQVLFGDVFAQRADYAKGHFYAGKRRYLKPPADAKVAAAEQKPGVAVNCLEPPDDFKTKAQLRHLRRNARCRTTDERMSFHTVNFQQKKAEIEDYDSTKKFRRVAALVKEMVTFEHFSSLNRRDWSEETQAGVRYWVNRHTGEVSADCPWLLLDDWAAGARPHTAPVRGAKAAAAAAAALGTGALVYEASAAHELLATLDRLAARSAGANDRRLDSDE